MPNDTLPGLLERAILVLMDLIKLIVWIIVGLLALSFFGISLRALVDTPTNQDNVEFLITTLQMGWDYIVSWWQGFSSVFDVGGN